MIYSEKANVQLSLLFSQFYSPCILDRVRYSYSSAVNICLYFSIDFPFSFSLAYIPFTGFLWFPLESFSSFLKTSYYFFPHTLVGTKPSRVSHDGTVLILPSFVKDTLSRYSFSLLHAEGVIPLSPCSHCFCGNVSHWWFCPSFLSAPPGAFLSVSGFEQFSCDASVHPPRVCAAWETLLPAPVTWAWWSGWGNSQHPLSPPSLAPPLPRPQLHS